MGLARPAQGARRRRCGDIVDDEQRRDRPQYLCSRTQAICRRDYFCRSQAEIGHRSISEQILFLFVWVIALARVYYHPILLNLDLNFSESFVVALLRCIAE
jgi:hypothetical protein